MAQQSTANIIQEVAYVLSMNQYELADTMGKTPQEAQAFQRELRSVISKHLQNNSEQEA